MEAETQMTSAERILEYCSLEQEPLEKVLVKYQPPTYWPLQGRIVVQNISVSYFKESNAVLALNDVSLTIEPGEKIGIVGRTGAGKTSFIQTLFRLTRLIRGQIFIDGIDITTVGLYDIRSRISIVPQDPTLFTGTLRTNLDPFGYYSDAEIWNVLEKACCVVQRFVLLS